MIRPQTRVLALLPVTAFVFGCLEYGPGRGPEGGSTLMMLHAVVSLALILAWFWIDSRARRYRASIFLHVAMAGLTVVALPYYLLRSRGFTGSLKSLGMAAVGFAGCMSAYHLGSLFA